MVAESGFFEGHAGDERERIVCIGIKT